MLKCPKCGSDLEYGMHECDFCFRKLTQRELTELERQHFQSDYAAKFAGQYKRKKSRKKWLIILSCVAAALIIVASVCRFAFQKSIFTVVKDGFSSLYGIVFTDDKEESDEEKFLRLESFAEQLNEQYKDSEYSKTLFDSYDDYLVYILQINLDTAYPNEFTDDIFTVKTYNGKITEFTWNDWTYIYYNGYSKVYPPQ